MQMIWHDHESKSIRLTESTRPSQRIYYGSSSNEVVKHFSTLIGRSCDVINLVLT